MNIRGRHQRFVGHVDTKTVKERREIRVGQLNVFSVHRGNPEMRVMLGASRGGMMQSEKRLGDVVRHRDVDVASSIIQGNFEPKIAGASPYLVARASKR
jgi:hypothetical protein